MCQAVHSVLVALVFVCFVGSSATSSDVAFPQPRSSRFLFAANATAGGAWPILPFSDVVQAVPVSGYPQAITALTRDGQLWMLDPFAEDLSPVQIDDSLGLNSTALETAVLGRPAEGGSLGSNGGLLAAASQDGYWICSVAGLALKSTMACTSMQFDFGAPVSSVQQTDEPGELYIGTLGNGLFHATAAEPTPSRIAEVTSSHVISLAYLASASSTRLAVGTRVKVFVWDSTLGWTWEWVAVPTGLVDGIVDAVPTAMAYLGSKESLWIGNVRCLNVQHADMTYRQVAAAQGLPYGNATAVATSGDQVWIGTSDGVIRFDGAAESGTPRRPWSLYRGNRWLPTGAVRSLAGVSCQNTSCSSMALVVSDTGLAVLSVAPMTLAEKAAHWQGLVEPRHNRWGLVSSCGLRSYGDLSSWEPEVGESDGLWTGVYLAGQCFRYAVTGDEAVREKAWQHFEAMEFLHNVTGIPGYVSRTFYRDGAAYSCSSCYNSTAYPGWSFQGDTSSDSLAGSMLVYPLVYKFIAESDAEKERVLRLVRLVTSHIVDNGFVYIGVDGQPTTWGRWNPQWIEEYPNSSERGVNSLQILSWLLNSYSMTKNETYLESFRSLADDYGYSYNVINQKVTCLADVNYSDNENAFLPYVDYIMANTSLLEPQLSLGMNRAWEFVSDSHCSLWDFIYSWHTGRTDFVQNSLETLRTWPLELIDWPTTNSNRLDVTESKYLTRSGTAQMEPPVLPYDEISYFRWNGNPFELDDSGSGYAEYDPGAPLTAYWLGRYLGVV